MTLQGDTMIYATQTTEHIDIVKNELEEKAKAIGFGVLKIYEFQKILEDKGFPIEKEIIVFELCNPTGAQQALTEISSLSVYLPCRISVYEENGVTILATIGFEDIINGIEVDEHFKSNMVLVFENLKQVMHSWDN